VHRTVKLGFVVSVNVNIVKIYKLLLIYIKYYINDFISREK